MFLPSAQCSDEFLLTFHKHIFHTLYLLISDSTCLTGVPCLNHEWLSGPVEFNNATFWWKCKESTDTKDGQKEWRSELRAEGPVWARVITGTVRGCGDSGNICLQVLLPSCKKLWCLHCTHCLQLHLLNLTWTVNPGLGTLCCFYCNLNFVHPFTVASWNLNYQEDLESKAQQWDRRKGTEQETKWG